MKSYWKITLVNGEVIDDDRCVHFSYGEEFLFKKPMKILTKEIVGRLWWKKEIETEENEWEVIYAIPKEQIRFVKKIKVED